MRAGKGNQEEDEYEEEEFGSKKPGASSNSTSISNNNISASNNKDGKSNDKANAIRSKHSVTEQRRRSKINERFQILRDLIPHTDQKRDTASFLLEVIEYVQFLQEKVQKYEGTYQGWSSEPTKLMPWRNSHWRSQSFVSPSPALKNGSGPGPTFPGRFDENNINATMCAQSQVESDPSRDVTPKGMDTHSELANKAMPVPIPPPIRCDGMLAHPMQKPVPDTQSTECPITSSVLNQQEELTIEGGIISVSSVYSQELLNSLTQALQSTGIDLSQANISVQIDLGKRTNRGLMCGSSTGKDFQNSSNQAMMHLRDVSSGEDSDPAQKRQKK